MENNKVYNACIYAFLTINKSTKLTEKRKIEIQKCTFSECICRYINRLIKRQFYFPVSKQRFTLFEDDNLQKYLTELRKNIKSIDIWTISATIESLTEHSFNGNCDITENKISSH